MDGVGPPKSAPATIRRSGFSPNRKSTAIDISDWVLHTGRNPHRSRLHDSYQTLWVRSKNVAGQCRAGLEKDGEGTVKKGPS